MRSTVPARRRKLPSLQAKSVQTVLATLHEIADEHGETVIAHDELAQRAGYCRASVEWAIYALLNAGMLLRWQRFVDFPPAHRASQIENRYRLVRPAEPRSGSGSPEMCRRQLDISISDSSSHPSPQVEELHQEVDPERDEINQEKNPHCVGSLQHRVWESRHRPRQSEQTAKRIDLEVKPRLKDTIRSHACGVRLRLGLDVLSPRMIPPVPRHRPHQHWGRPYSPVIGDFAEAHRVSIFRVPAAARRLLEFFAECRVKATGFMPTEKTLQKWFISAKCLLAKRTPDDAHRIVDWLARSGWLECGAENYICELSQIGTHWDELLFLARYDGVDQLPEEPQVAVPATARTLVDFWVDSGRDIEPTARTLADF